MPGIDPTPYLEGWRERARAERLDVEKARSRARNALPAIVGVLRARGARRIWLIGSLGRGTFGCRSDVDVMTEGLEESAVGPAEREATERSGLAVDVIRAEALAPGWRRHHETFGEKLHG